MTTTSDLLCQRRVRRLEAAINRLLIAHDKGEMSSYQASLERLRRLLGER